MLPIKSYACYNKNRDVRMASSSGAVFSSLAEYVLDKQGVVYGVAMSEDCYSAEYVAVSNKKDLLKLRCSKYLQARVGKTYKMVKEDLQSGKVVFFTGTGCQINGLKYYLGKEYDNLLCADVICHGVPSPALWKEYAQYQEMNNGGKLKSVNFRCKDVNWVEFGLKAIYDNINTENDKRVYVSKNRDSYMYMFLSNYCLRPSCYECLAKKEKLSDLTIADFWGIKDVAPEMYDGKGTSLVLIRTNKGKKYFDYIRNELILKEVSYEDGVKLNPAEYKSCSRPQQRDTFFFDMNTMTFDELEKKYVISEKNQLKVRIKRMIKNLIRNCVMCVWGGGNAK